MYKNRIQTCCELPNDLLGVNKKLNDYDFVLYHLFISNQKYHDYYLNLSHNTSRTIIFDNSAYEFFVKGAKLDIPQFMDAIQELRPQIALLPDVLMAKEATIQGVKECLHMNPGSYIPQWMAVVQGNSTREFLECINVYKELGIKNIAIPFHNTFLKEDLFERGEAHIENMWRLKFGRITEDMRYALGRIELVWEMWGYLRGFDRIHFLGSHNPYEKVFLEQILGNNHFDKTTISMDTGYPTKVALEGYALFEEPSKPEVILDDFIDEEIADMDKPLIISNIQKFHDL